MGDNFIFKFIEQIAKQKGAFYRGHSDKNYKLEPSVYRTKKPLVKHEHDLVREAISYNTKEFNLKVSNFEKLSLMQHYGFPTRLLDITENPLVALYFSVSSNDKKDGCVKVFNIPDKLIKHYDSDVVSVLSSLSYIEPIKFNKFDEELRENIEKSDIKTLKDRVLKNKHQKSITTLYNFYTKANKEDKIKCIEILNNTQLLEYIVYEIQKEKSNFRKIIKPEHFNNAIVCIKPKLDNQRIMAQQGAFLIYGIKDGDKKIIPDISKSDIKISNIIVPFDKKKQVSEFLDKIGINEQRLFPEIDRSAIHITKKYKRKS